MKWLNFSGPNVARLFQKLLALLFLDAWISLASQLDVLVGPRGLLPAQPFIDAVHGAHIPFWRFPTLFYWGAPHWALVAGIVLGIALALCALFGFFPRAAFGVSTVLYLGYAVIGRTFLSFQWDNLLLECGTFAVFLPTDRPAPAIHLLFRLILFKLYWESGLAKWQSSIRDWQDGSAMTFYYETAPLPTALAYFAHHAPVWWHHLESWATLAFELVLPFAIFAPWRRVRHFAAGFFTFFQVVNALTANYGFFCYLACALHVFLLDDSDVERLFHIAPKPMRWEWARALVLAIFAAISTVECANSFAGTAWLPRLAERWAPFRLVNTYHLFGSITRERIEPQFQTFDGTAWSEHDLHYKPGDPARRPPYVAPHQPRVDFQLWFYGLGYRYRPPEYVMSLLDRLCHDPEAVQPLFADPLPAHPQSVRIVFWRYHFAPPGKRWWTREEADETRPLPCH